MCEEQGTDGVWRLLGVLLTQDWEILVASFGDHPVGILAGYTGDGTQTCKTGLWEFFIATG